MWEGVKKLVKRESENLSSFHLCPSCLSERKIFAIEKYLWEKISRVLNFVAEVLNPESGAKNVCHKLKNWLLHLISSKQSSQFFFCMKINVDVCKRCYSACVLCWCRYDNCDRGWFVATIMSCIKQTVFISPSHLNWLTAHLFTPCLSPHRWMLKCVLLASDNS